MAKTIQVKVGEPIEENEVIDKAKLIQGSPAPAPKSDVEGQAHPGVNSVCPACGSFNVYSGKDYDYQYYRCWNCTAIFRL